MEIKNLVFTNSHFNVAFFANLPSVQINCLHGDFWLIYHLVAKILATNQFIIEGQKWILRTIKVKCRWKWQKYHWDWNIFMGYLEDFLEDNASFVYLWFLYSCASVYNYTTRICHVNSARAFNSTQWWTIHQMKRIMFIFAMVFHFLCEFLI